MNHFSKDQLQLIGRLQKEIQDDLGVFRFLMSNAAFFKSLESEFVDQLLLCLESHSDSNSKSYCIVAASDDVKKFETLLSILSASLNSDEYALLSIYESGIAGRQDAETLNFV